MPLQVPDLVRRRALLAMAVVAGAACSRVEPAPPFANALLDGSLHDAAALRGQVVLMNFRATRCVKDMPRVAATHHRFDGRGLTTLAEPA